MIGNYSWILIIHKARILRKKTLEKNVVDFKNWVKSAGYNGPHTVSKTSKPKNSYSVSRCRISCFSAHLCCKYHTVRCSVWCWLQNYVYSDVLNELYPNHLSKYELWSGSSTLFNLFQNYSWMIVLRTWFFCPLTQFSKEYE